MRGVFPNLIGLVTGQSPVRLPVATRSTSVQKRVEYTFVYTADPVRHAEHARCADAFPAWSKLP